MEKLIADQQIYPYKYARIVKAIEFAVSMSTDKQPPFVARHFTANALNSVFHPDALPRSGTIGCGPPTMMTFEIVAWAPTPLPEN